MGFRLSQLDTVQRRDDTAVRVRPVSAAFGEQFASSDPIVRKFANEIASEAFYYVNTSGEIHASGSLDSMCSGLHDKDVGIRAGIARFYAFHRRCEDRADFDWLSSKGLRDPAPHVRLAVALALLNSRIATSAFDQNQKSIAALVDLLPGEDRIAALSARALRHLRGT